MTTFKLANLIVGQGRFSRLACRFFVCAGQAPAYGRSCCCQNLRMDIYYWYRYPLSAHFMVFASVICVVQAPGRLEEDSRVEEQKLTYCKPLQIQLHIAEVLSAQANRSRRIRRNCWMGCNFSSTLYPPSIVLTDMQSSRKIVWQSCQSDSQWGSEGIVDRQASQTQKPAEDAVCIFFAFSPYPILKIFNRPHSYSFTPDTAQTCRKYIRKLFNKLKAPWETFSPAQLKSGSQRKATATAAEEKKVCNDP